MRLAGTVPLLAAVAALSACAPESPDHPELPQPTVLTLTTPEPRGVYCEAGGTRVDVGLDDGGDGGVARNGVLEPGEIDRTTWVCNGSSAPGSCTPSPGAPVLDVAVNVSTPGNGQYFVPGERPVLTIRFIDACDQTASLGQTSRAHLFLTGPRRGVTLTQTAHALLNCVVDRDVADGQHHFIDLRAPSYAHVDPEPNLSISDDGLLTYTLEPVTAEPPGTYTAAVYGETLDGVIQFFRLADLQIGTASPEDHGFLGTGATSVCTRCHFGVSSGRVQMAHSLPAAGPGVPASRYGLDSAPVSGCVACHNTEGFSANPLVRKVHGVHRGAKLAAPGAAHPDYGLAEDPSLAAFVNVEFPIQPGREKDCEACHADDRWATAPSRLACGTCHDAVNFESGTLSPPRRIPRAPGAPACTETSCGAGLTCNLSIGLCERHTHPPEPSATTDAQCAECHGADTGTSPVRARHEILERTRVRGLALAGVTLSGGSGPSGAFRAGDFPVLGFRLEYEEDFVPVPVPDLVSSTTSLRAVVSAAGPLDEAQRIYEALDLRAGCAPGPCAALAYDAGTGRYGFALPALPSASLPPLNTSVSPPHVVPLVTGTYRLALYVSERVVVGPAVTDAASAVVDFALVAGGDPPAPVRPRQRVTEQACDACHDRVQYHGGTRPGVAGCMTCHTDHSEDPGVGSRGRACTSDFNCPGFAQGWEACLDTADPVGKDTCVVTQDPTPGRSLEVQDMIHRMHGARLLGGYAESVEGSAFPGLLTYVGSSHAIVDFTDHLFSVDLRNCKACHADAANTCTSDLGCGYGQTCVSGRCRNVSWTEPSTEACLTCHDTPAAVAHARLETWNGIEACGACHGPTNQFSVAASHSLEDPSIPVRPRLP